MDARTRFTLEVHNLFDTTYYAASWGALTVLPGLGRQVVASVKVAF
jgi:iron complex outermembrane receptor protein